MARTERDAREHMPPSTGMGLPGTATHREEGQRSSVLGQAEIAPGSSRRRTSSQQSWVGSPLNTSGKSGDPVCVCQTKDRG